MECKNLKNTSAIPSILERIPSELTPLISSLLLCHAFKQKWWIKFKKPNPARSLPSEAYSPDNKFYIRFMPQDHTFRISIQSLGSFQESNTIDLANAGILKTFCFPQKHILLLQFSEKGFTSWKDFTSWGVIIDLNNPTKFIKKQLSTQRNIIGGIPSQENDNHFS